MLPKDETGSEKPQLLSEEFPVLYENRYCDQEDVCVVMCGTLSVNNKRKITLFEIENRNKTFIKLPPMFKGQYNCKTTAIGSSIYLQEIMKNVAVIPVLNFYQVKIGRL